MTVKEWVAFWQKNYDVPGVRHTTYEAHRYVLENHILPWIGDCPLESLTTQKIERFLEEHQLDGNKRNGKPLSQQTMRHIQNLLSKVLRQAATHGLIERNPVQGICCSAPKKVKATILADNEVRDYLSAAEELGYLPIFLLALEYGLRQRELIALMWGDLDIENCTLTIHEGRAVAYDGRFKKWRYDDLPILPEPFRYVLVTGKEDTFENLRRLMDRPDVDTVVNACDAGREGELIFRLVYDMAGCSKPVERLWISSMENMAIREGFSDLRPGVAYDALYQSALCRQKADWLVGINATRLFSVLYHRTLNVGRVQTPTLAMLAERDAKINGFQKEKYHHVRLKVDGAEAVSEKIISPEDAQTVKAACSGASAVCTSVTRAQKKEQPPKLYDLTTLQREANRIFGYTAKQTLDYAQSLYEKKLLTYPRTDSRYLTSDMAETASCVIHLAAKEPPFDGCGSFFPLVELMISDRDVSDHHAIIPTMEIEKADVKALPVGERNLLRLVCCRLLCASANPYEYEAVTATFDCGGHTFTAKGRRILSEGWREIERIFRSSLKEKPEDTESGGVLPAFTEGQTFRDVAVSVTEHFTSPPKPYTEDTLLSAMENAGKEDIPEDAERKGLGTPATRAAIIEKLVTAGFVERKGKSLIPTKAGINLVAVLPEPLTSPMLTAEWEQKLTEIARGGADPDTFMDGIRTMVRELVSTYSCISEDGKSCLPRRRK